MKKYFTLLLILVTVNFVASWGQSLETRNLNTFNRISLRLQGKVVIRQGDPQKVQLEASKETLSTIKTEVKDGKLIIENSNKWSWKGNKNNDDLVVYITVKDIIGLSVSGSGELISEGKIKTNKLELDVSGSGSLRVMADVDSELSTEVSGSGKIDVKGSSHSMKAAISGSGKIKSVVTVAHQMDVTISGSGQFESSGQSDKMKTSINGSGKIYASELKVNQCDVRISGSGSVEIDVKNTLNVDILGSGTVYYKSEPSNVNSKSTGSGKVRKME